MPDSLSGHAGPALAGAAAVSRFSTLLRELAGAPPDDLRRAWQQRLRPGDVVGRFEILREIGRGGFGVVYEALDCELGRSVAFKTLRPALAGQELSSDWILKEAEAVARLEHACIVTLYDVGRCESGPYLVEELLRGETLADRLSAGPLGVRDAVAIAVELARGLAHAHARGVLHRDLKPSNVFLTDDGRVKLLDFGVAHLLGTRSLNGVGTPAYMAPEQLRGEVVDTRADVFALGATLYDALVGTTPFQVKDGRSAALDRGPPPTFPRGTPPRVADLLRRCLARDPAERPASGQAALEELLVLAEVVERAARGGRVTPARSTRLRFFLLFAVVGAATGAGVYLAATRGRSVLSRGVTASAPDTLASVAVLPFADLSPGTDQAYFADGVAEEIRTALANVPGLKVVGRSSSAAMKARADDLETIGEKLGVGLVVEGSLRKDGNRVRVTAELIRLVDTRVLWSQSYDRSVAGLFDVQDEVAKSVVGALRLKLLPSATYGPGTATRHPEAYQQFLLGRALVLQSTDESNGRAITALERALKLDPELAPAHAWLSYACWNLTSVTRGEERLGLERRGRLAADRAVAVAPAYSTGYSARGYWRMGVDWDWAGSQRDFERAVELGPGDETAVNGLARLMMALGRFEEGVKLRRRAVEMDPLDVAHLENLADDLLYVGAPDEAREMARRAMEILPESYYSQMVLAEADLLEGKAEAALERFRRLPEGRRLVGVAAAAFSAGQDEVSLAALAQLESDRADRALDIAAVHSWRGDADGAFRWLGRAYQERDRDLFSIKNSYLFRSIRGDPRYAALLRKMRLPGD